MEVAAVHKESVEPVNLSATFTLIKVRTLTESYCRLCEEWIISNTWALIYKVCNNVLYYSTTRILTLTQKLQKALSKSDLSNYQYFTMCTQCLLTSIYFCNYKNNHDNSVPADIYPSLPVISGCLWQSKAMGDTHVFIIKEHLLAFVCGHCVNLE